MGKRNGISIYPNNLSLNETLNYIHKAGKLDFEYVFTSLHIPEWTLEEQLQFLKDVAQVVHNYEMKLITDIRGSVIQTIVEDKYLKSCLEQIQLDGIRLDFEMTKETLQTIKSLGIQQVIINASILNKEDIQYYSQVCQKLGLTVTGCHNYYPRPETGLSLEFYLKQNKLFDEFQLDVIAFIPSLQNPRGPIFSGLPTLERHRNLSLEEAVLELSGDLSTQQIFFGDGFASDRELGILQRISVDQIVDLDIILFDENYQNLIFSKNHPIRYDSGKYQFRIDGVRQMASYSQLEVLPNNTINRNKGAITLDNQDYLRYQGELQIIKHNLPADKRVNVIGQVSEKDLWKLNYLSSDYQIHFVEKGDIH